MINSGSYTGAKTRTFAVGEQFIPGLQDWTHNQEVWVLSTGDEGIEFSNLDIEKQEFKRIMTMNTKSTAWSVTMPSGVGAIGAPAITWTANPAESTISSYALTMSGSWDCSNDPWVGK